MAYISEHYSDQPTPETVQGWVEERTTPDEWVGSTTYEFRGGDWVVTIDNPVVAPDQVIRKVVVANQATGFRWEGEVDAKGKVTDPAGRPGLAPDSDSGASLPGTKWQLTSLNGESLIEGTEIDLYFKDAFLGGSMTCNGYGGGPDSGAYIATDDGALTLGEYFAVTVQLCAEPKGIMEQEAAYIEALLGAETYRIVGGRLLMSDSAGETILVFDAHD
jgi:heat shock protein HslJ